MMDIESISVVIEEDKKKLVWSSEMKEIGYIKL